MPTTRTGTRVGTTEGIRTTREGIKTTRVGIQTIKVGIRTGIRTTTTDEITTTGGLQDLIGIGTYRRTGTAMADNNHPGKESGVAVAR